MIKYKRYKHQIKIILEPQEKETQPLKLKHEIFTTFRSSDFKVLG